ncbi:alpha-(1-_3)-arabinofuranosyltransferase family protein [Nocardioides sp. HM23]|uniref:alpha-(1->3)-arabinofuranosyltransferase domain-containing protein n=1 Tax=Nocardioides bizhenqiangii TaxID=3095076 RepID=UPI002ACAED5F|nr:alpha-(1->3)-arabinofuranosyltransferase family protein [Nocardioides sp. HM23]MDZ5620576.1 alpha-(1->3)-arabinofuranosyltransferase family protein [Nocardioides sp. HM23]
MRDTREASATGAAIASCLYAVIAFFMLVQQPGATTYDTRAELTERPGSFLSGAFTLWHPEANLGEFQNQAYGYLFPQGAWFVLTDAIGTPGWVSQRLWSALILIVACEGARRVARAVGLSDLPALLAGVVFAFSPRLLGTVAVQTGESLPGAVMPWLVLVVILHLRGRLSPLRTAVLSGAAVVCMGGVNAVETAACLPLAMILVVWGVTRRLTSVRAAVGWFAAVVAGCLWWALPLLVLARFAPPFYQYVESAQDTTALIGWSEASRGDSSWIAYLVSGDQPWWPAAFHLATDPVLVVVAAVVAGVGLLGLTLLDSAIKRPLMLAVVLGLGCLTIAHGGPAGAPVADVVRGLLDGALQIFRNVHKIDPVVRLPIAIGFGCAVARGVQLLVERAPGLRTAERLLLLAPLLVVLVLGRPYLQADARTPGWDEIPSYWQDTRSYLAEHAPGGVEGGRTLVVPGSRFAQHEWGWTLDEPLAILGDAPMVSRSQVPLIPGESIRYLSALDQLIATGRATEALVGQLARAGVTHVVLRRDLLRGVTGSPHPGASAVSLARAGLERVAGFGRGVDGAAQVEVFEVPDQLPLLRATPADDVVTVRGAAESVLAVEGGGLVGADAPTVLEGEPGWERAATVVTDSDQRRERAFGNNDESLSAIMTATEPWRVDRAAHDFPGGPGDQVVARYDGLASVTASSAQGYADNYGPVLVQAGPAAAVDGDIDTQWVSSVAGEPDEQWLRLDFDEARPVREVTITPVADDPAVVPIRTLEVVAGSQRIRVGVNTSGAPAVVELDGSEVDSVEIRVLAAATADRGARVGLREVAVDGLRPERTLVLPGSVPGTAGWAFSTTPGRRACFVVLGAPDCDVARIRVSEEKAGLDRTFTLDGRQQVSLTGHVVARSTPEAARLLDLIQRRPPIIASSTYGQDPRVAPRFAYDGQRTTAWVSDDGDLYPTLTFRWRKLRTITGITVASGEQAPVGAVVTANGRTQRVRLSGDTKIALERVRTHRLVVRFEKPPEASHVVVPEIEIAGLDVTRPFDPELRTGAVCGLGPVLSLDGRQIATRVTGTMADVVNGSPLALEACDERTGAPVDIDVGEGEHRLHATPTADFEVIDLRAGGGPLPPYSPRREVSIERWDGSERTAEVGAGEETLLSVPENYNDGWVAEVDGEELTPVRVDGWQQGWVLPAGEQVTVELRYRPQATYDVILPLGLAVSGALLLGALVIAVLGLVARIRGRRPSAAPDVAWPAADAPDRVVWAAAVGAALLLLGPVAAVGVVAGAVGGRWLLRVAGAGGALIALSGLLDALGRPETFETTADLAAALGVGLVAGLVLGLPQRRPPRLTAGEGTA